jgi:uncharacterized membrane protein
MVAKKKSRKQAKTKTKIVYVERKENDDNPLKEVMPMMGTAMAATMGMGMVGVVSKAFQQAPPPP